MPNLLLVGESGMGKTMIIEKFTRDHASSFDDTSGRLHMPVVAVQMVSGPDEAGSTAEFWPRLVHPNRRARRFPSWKAWPCGCSSNCAQRCW